MKILIKCLAAAMLAFKLSMAWAQGQGEAADAVQHAGHRDDAAPMVQTSMTAMDHSTMDQGSMNMQAGSSPADARDPHAYSGGYTVDSGPYVLPGPRQLHLADEHSFGALLVNRLERVHTRDANASAYDVQAWFGRDYDRLAFKGEGEIAKSKVQDARTELLWKHAVATFWDTQLGIRYDSGVGPDREWLAFGIQGLAPYWFELDATAYVGSKGRSAFRLEAEYELPLTQKLVLQPRFEANLYGKRDEARDIGSGLSDAVTGLRLRYEITRQFAPYIGIERAVKFGETADLARAAGESSGQTQFVAGLRFWF
ncbi:MAG: copper resistance protein B [Burkholderiales bacterium]